MYYLKELKEDIRRAIDDDNYKWDFEEMSKDDIIETLNDDLWIDDSVTGNGSGSYYFNSYEAKETVLNRLDEVKEAYEEFGMFEELGKDFVNEEWKKIDVTCRCAFLYQAISEVIEEEEN